MTGRKIRAVIDTNVFISAHLSNKGASYEIIRKWRKENSFDVITQAKFLKK